MTGAENLSVIVPFRALSKLRRDFAAHKMTSAERTKRIFGNPPALIKPGQRASLRVQARMA